MAVASAGVDLVVRRPRSFKAECGARSSKGRGAELRDLVHSVGTSRKSDSCRAGTKSRLVVKRATRAWFGILLGMARAVRSACYTNKYEQSLFAEENQKRKEKKLQFT